jgi:hypothetical protein
MEPSTLLGPVDQLEPYIEFVILGLVALNLAARALAHRRHVSQAEDGGADALSPHPAHHLSNALLVLGSFYYATVQPHGGTVMSVLVVGAVLSDVFEFEARKVEARKDEPLERPKAALFSSTLVLLYALYQTLFFLVKPLWTSVI